MLLISLLSEFGYPIVTLLGPLVQPRLKPTYKSLDNYATPIDLFVPLWVCVSSEVWYSASTQSDVTVIFLDYKRIMHYQIFTVFQSV